MSGFVVFRPAIFGVEIVKVGDGAGNVVGNGVGARRVPDKDAIEDWMTRRPSNDAWFTVKAKEGDANEFWTAADSAAALPAGRTDNGPRTV